MSTTRSSRHGGSSHVVESRPWQEKLEEACRECQMNPPVFQIVSDRRGGRTAWSSRVTIGGQNVAARFWYDGKNLNNAKEDAAEVALSCVFGSNTSSPSSSRHGGGW